MAKRAKEDTAVLAARAAEVLKIAGDATRLHILWLLADRDHFVGEMCAVLGSSQPAVSHSLSLLRVSGMVSARRDGKRSYYAVTDRGRAVADAARAVGA